VKTETAQPLSVPIRVDLDSRHGWTFNALEAALAAPQTRVRPSLAGFALLLVQNASTGLAIGLGIAAGLALAR
jgi:hypothetical protein